MNTSVNPDTDPTKNLRSDLWPSMTISELAVQQELVLDKLSRLHGFIGPNATKSMLNIYGALHTALQDLNSLIDNKSNQK
jgi:hypothetical protein